MDSTTHMNVSWCPLLGFGLLVGLIIWLSIRSPKAGAVASGVLAACILGGLLLVGSKAPMAPGGWATQMQTPWANAPGAFGARKLVFIAIPLFIFLFISLVVWGFARNPKKGFAVMGGLFLSLLLLGIFAILAAILLPAMFRARQIAGRDAAASAPQVVAELPLAVLAATTRPTGDDILNDPWVMAAASANPGSEFACRELACAAMTRRAIQTLRTAGRIAGEAGPRFVLTMEARDPTTLDIWKRAEPAMRAAARAEFQERADRLVQIAWNPNSGPGTLEAEHLLGGAVLRWSERSQQSGGRWTVTAELFMPAERHVRLAREGQRPADGEVRGSVTETSWRNVVHFNKSWVLGLDWPAGRPGPFIVARSEPADSSEAARQAAERDARRQLAERLRAQVAQAVAVDRYLGRTEPLFADGLSVNTDLLRQQADELRAQAEQVAAYARGTAEATPVRMDEILSGTDTLLREAGRLVAQAQEMGASARDQRASRAVAEARSQAAAVRREAELLRMEAQRAAAAARTAVDTSLAGRDARAAGGDRTSAVRERAEKLGKAAQRTEARARDLSGRTAAQADRLTESIDAAATAAVSSGASRLDEFLQPLDSSSGRRWMGAVLIDASPSAMDALAARVIAPPAPEAPRTADRPHRFYTIGVLLLMIILAYAFLAAGRYAFFKWPVRVAVAGAFAALCVMAMHFSEGLSAAADGRAAQTALSRAVSIFRPSPSLAERLVALAQTSADGVATAVATAESTEMDDARLKPLDLLVCGEYRIVGGDAVGAIKAIELGIRRGGCENWYQKSLGLARLRAGQVSEARRAFARAAGDPDAWRRRPVANGSLDAWTAAYFLDLVSQAEYTNNTARDDRYACFPWFYVGQRMEIEGERDKAIAAYRKSVELGERSGAHYISHWSAYRLGVLTGTIRAPSSQPGKKLPADVTGSAG